MVVISIIAILSSLLLPALGRAREAGHRGVCLSNMKQLHLGYQMYDLDFGRLPALPKELDPAASAQSVGYELKNNYGAITDWMGFGQLFNTGYLNSGRAFYCPSPMNRCQTGASKGLLGYDGANGWGRWAPGNSFVWSNYWQRWNEYDQWREASVSPGSVATMSCRLSKNSGDRWLASDAWGFYCRASTSEWWMPHPASINILFIDGHAATSTDSMAKIVGSGGNHTNHINQLIGTWGVTTP